MSGRFHCLLGALIWLLFMIAWRPLPQHPRWIYVLLLFSPLVLMPLAQGLWRKVHHDARHRVFLVPSAALLAPAFAMDASWLAALCALPWLLFCSTIAVETLADWRQGRVRTVGDYCLASARIFPAIGAAWLSAERLGIQPLGFDRLIVLLTAAHFHHAGFTLPLMAGLHARVTPGWLSRSACVLILVGVPLVAVGITFTHLAAWHWIEPWAVSVLVSGALAVAVLQVAMVFDSSIGTLPRVGMLLSGLALGLAMSFALGYGLRFIFPSLALSIPSMWALHGTLNTFGFGLIGILAWSRSLVHKPDV